MIDKGKENTAAKAAQTLGFDDIDRALAGGGTAPKENKAGSYERLIGWATAGMTKRQ